MRLCQQYRIAKYKKYFFLPPEPHQSPELITDNSKQRIEEELELYRSLKDDDRLVNIDGGLTYFLISAQWIQKWRDFITYKGPVPGPIENQNLAEKIFL